MKLNKFNQVKSIQFNVLKKLIRKNKVNVNLLVGMEKRGRRNDLQEQCKKSLSKRKWKGSMKADFKKLRQIIS